MPTFTEADFIEARNFIQVDIEREIQLARTTGDPAKEASLKAAGLTSLGGGNFLAALGLLCYTEFCGALEFNHKKQITIRKVLVDAAMAGDNFNDFFNTLGTGNKYKTFNDAHGVYGLFRCGMAHQYNVKTSHFNIIMPKENPDASGIGITFAGGTYNFFVATYYRDLKVGLDRLEKELKAKNRYPIALPDY